jgi:hypothetical protein
LATSAEAALEVASAFVALGLAPAVIAGSAEPADRIVAQVLGPMHAERPPAADEGSGFLLVETEASARARGARVLAELVRLAARAAEIDPPHEPSAARVVVTRADHVDALLKDSPWLGVERVTLAPHVGRHEARGAFALAAASALIAAGECEEALVIGRDRDRAHCTHLKRFAMATP